MNQSTGRTAVLAVLVLVLVLSGPASSAQTGTQAPAAPKTEAAQPTPRPLLLAKDTGAVTKDLQTQIPVLLEKGHVPGLQIALIRDGKIVWNGAFGVKNATTKEPVTDETIFECVFR